ncbi:MAG TPA: hypothetical protein VLJ84_09840 [Usitatibacter sp.]|nr:hypothetical protein [Usitatibacter sp.]
MTTRTDRSSALPSAKLQLLDWLEASGSWEAMLLSDELLDARTFRELAERAHGIVVRLQEVNEWKVAGAFWEAAKDIVSRWRDAAIASRHSPSA